MSDNLPAEIMREVKRYDDGNGCTRRQLVDSILTLISQTSNVPAPCVTDEEHKQNARKIIDAWRDEWHLEPEPELDGEDSKIYESLVSHIARALCGANQA